MVSVSDSLIDDLRSQWKWFIAFGIAIAIVGLVALSNVVDATLVTTGLVGFLLVAAGVMDIVAAFARGRSVPARLLHAILGSLYIVVGVELVADPLRGAVTVAVVVAAMLILDGVIRLIEAIAYRPPHAGLLAVIAVVNILLGAWLWSGLPVSALAIGFYVGVELLMTGVAWIALGWMARSGFDAPVQHAETG